MPVNTTSRLIKCQATTPSSSARDRHDPLGRRDHRARRSAVPLPKPQPAIRTDEDTIALLTPNDQLRSLFVDESPAGYVPIVDAMPTLAVSRQTVLQRVKRGQLQAIHVRQGRRKGLRIRVPTDDGLFDPTTMNAEAV